MVPDKREELGDSGRQRIAFISFFRFFFAGLLDCYGALLGCFWLELGVLTGYLVKSWEIF